jgi:hypothetical protein
MKVCADERAFHGVVFIPHFFYVPKETPYPVSNTNNKGKDVGANPKEHSMIANKF